MKILSVIKDDRISATSVLVEMHTEAYLNLVSGAEDNLEIQRKVIKGFKPYERLRQDLKEGCLIPPVVLGIRKGRIDTPDNPSDEKFIPALKLIPPGDVFVIDGLQRTTAIQNVRDSLEGEELTRFLSRPLRVEIWPDIKLSALTYRMILLNAGQKPMSLKHQLEVVSRPLCENLAEKYDGRISIYREKDSNRRSGHGQYQFSVIAQAFQAFVQKSPHIDVRNEVIAELNQIDVLTNYGDSLEKSSGKTDLTTEFESYIGFLVDFDEELCRKYTERKETNEGVIIPTGVNLLSRDTFHLGLAAAYGWCIEHKKDALETAKYKLFNLLKEDADDPLAIERLERIQTGFRRKDNTGEQTRNLIFNGFKEYFRSEGLTPFEQCWMQA
ncbi:hypothetical protein [Desulforhabdus sp. TSK]|uniref:hypothetical protein n=1 Tax=Desulforhabdus sp. TSK TaxID=2925014 RepID=UPI001FC8E6FD|nr:hypothetical protein [Desulforhabdus sp. TSK]GKT06964.1 hypothetical protein DSTSK_02690 [Desulforhabdus sp. TSK]